MATWQENFRERYTSPRVENVTVGFSGIDPNSRANSTITDEYITNLTLNYLSSLPISIDSGDITPGADPPEVQPVTLKPSEIPHEMLDGLLGGNTSGHYHLTGEELAKLHAYPEIENLNVLLTHEGLHDLQGGESGAHYHLSAAELQRLRNIVDALIPNKDTGVVIIPQPISDHERLSNLKGGATSEHYHFTLNEWTKLLKVLAVLFTDGATEPQFPSALSNPDALNTIIDTRIQEYLRANTPEAEINTDTLEELIREYLTDNPPEGTINTEALNARIAAYMAEHPIEQPTIDTEALNTAIDARIEQYFEENPIETEIDANTISTMIDTRIQQYLQNLNGGEVTEPDSDNP